MKNLKYILSVFVLLLCVAFTRAEAATVAVVPLINKVEFATAEEEKVPNMVYMNQAMNILKNKQGFMLVENERVRYAIKTNVEPYKMPTREQLVEVCKKGNVDIVFAMELVNYDYTVKEQTTTRMAILNVRANLVSYNRLTNEYTIKKCVNDEELDETFTSRWDIVQEAWSKMVRQEFDRITRVKKK